MPKVFKGSKFEYALELVSKDADGHPTYGLRRNSDDAVVATIRRYVGSIRTPIGRSRLVKHGKLRNFWQWSFNRDYKPDMHTGRTSFLNESASGCVNSIINLLERDF